MDTPLQSVLSTIISSVIFNALTHNILDVHINTRSGKETFKTSSMTFPCRKDQWSITTLEWMKYFSQHGPSNKYLRTIECSRSLLTNGQACTYKNTLDQHFKVNVFIQGAGSKMYSLDIALKHGHTPPSCSNTLPLGTDLRRMEPNIKPNYDIRFLNQYGLQPLYTISLWLLSLPLCLIGFNTTYLLAAAD